MLGNEASTLTAHPDNAPTARPFVRRLATLMAVAIGGAAIGIAAAPSAAMGAGEPPGDVPASPWTFERVTGGYGGVDSDGESADGTLSADGNHIVFETNASNLRSVPSPWISGGYVMSKNLATGEVTLQNVAGNGSSMRWPYEPVIDADGDRIAFTYDTGYDNRVALRDTVTGTATSVANFAPANRPAISDAGDRVALLNNQGESTDDKRAYVYVYDTGESSSTLPVLVRLTDLTVLTHHADKPVISGDGNTIAYEMIVPDGNRELTDIRIQDITDLANPAPASVLAGRLPSLSSDGRYVAFAHRSAATSWIDSIHVYDRLTGVDTTVIELPEQRYANEVHISGDGSTVAYVVAGSGDAEAWVTNLATGRTETVMTSDWYGDRVLDLSTDGKALVFTTNQSLVTDDLNGMSDVYIARRSDASGPVWPAGAELSVTGAGGSYVSVAWPAATDDTNVANYQVLVDGAPVALVPGSTTSHTITGLAPETPYLVSVIAVDGDGNGSTILHAEAWTQAGTSEPGTASLLASATGGRVTLTWDPEASAEGYRILRADEEGGEFVPVADVAADTTTYTDGDRAANHQYVYRVELLAGGVQYPHTVETTVTTGEPSVDTVTWTGRGQLGATISVMIDGAPGWTGVAEVDVLSWFSADGTELEQPAPMVLPVLAVEDAARPGRYLAELTIADGIAQITGIQGVVTDQQGADDRVGAARLPLAIRGAVSVEVVAAEASLPGARIVIDGVAQTSVSGGATWESRSVPAGHHVVRVLSAQGRQLGGTEVDVRDGRLSAVSVTPLIPGSLAVRAVLGDGSDAAGVLVEFRSADNTFLGVVTTDANGLAIAPGDLAAGDVVTARLNPARGTPYQPSIVELTVQPAGSVVDVALERIGTAVLRGRVLIGGQPAAGAVIAMTQLVNDGSSAFSAITNDEGYYEIVGVGGPAHVRLTYRTDPGQFATVVLWSEPTQLDFELLRGDQYRIDVTVRTRTAQNPQWQVVQDSSRIAYGYQGRIHVGDRAPQLVTGDAIVTAVPGEVVSFCVDGSRYGMGQQCDTVTLGADRTVDLSVDIESAATVVGRLVGHSTASATPVSLLKVESDGRRRTMAINDVYGSAVEISTPEPGEYELVVGSGGLRRIIPLVLAAGDVLNVGDIVLAASPWAQSSSVTTSRSVISVGGITDVRIALMPNASAMYRGIAITATLPAGTELVEGSVTVDGSPAAAEIVNGTLRIGLGDHEYQAGQLGTPIVVRYRLGADSVEPGADLQTVVHATAIRAGSTAPTVGIVGSVSTHVASVSIEAPETSASRTLALSGRAPSGAEVRVSDYGADVGVTTASAGGFWHLTVELPDYGNGFEHVLQAVSEYDGDVLPSERANVLVDDRYPTLKNVTMMQRNGHLIGRLVSFDPTEGVARFPYMFAGSPGTFEIGAMFEGEGTVDNVVARIGRVSAPAVPHGNGSFMAQATLVQAQSGDIAIDYDPVPAMITEGDLVALSEQQVRSVLPPGVAEFVTTSVTDSHDAATNNYGLSVRSDVPAYGDDAAIETSLSVTHGVTYTPSASELAAAERIGVPVYGLAFSSSKTDNELRISGHMFVPVSFFEQQSSAAFASSSMAALNPIGGVVRVGFNNAFLGGQFVDGALGAWTADGKFNQLGDLLDWINQNCDDPVTADTMRMRADMLSREMLASEGVKVGLMVGGAVAGAFTAGLGTALVWSVGFFLDKAIDYANYNKLQELTTTANSECRDEDEPDARWPDRRPWDPTDDPEAVPTWIHDPSGYVFEAVPSNRVEGVTATLLYAPQPEGPFSVWDAEWFEQTNPLVTDSLGAYGWDVPEGFWQVVFTKDGYETARSEVLEVLPPHFDVNVGVTRHAPATVGSVVATGGRQPHVDVTFDNYMQLSASGRITVTDADGNDVTGSISAVDAEDGAAGRFATTFRFVPNGGFASGTLNVMVDALASDHAGRPMERDFATTVEVVQPDETAPVVSSSVDTQPNAAGWHRRAATVTITADDGLPEIGATGVREIRWRSTGAQPGEGVVEGAVTTVTISTDGDTVVRFTAIDAAGNESVPQELRVRIDSVAPVATIVAPVDGASFKQGQSVNVSYQCTDAVSGIASCTGDVANGGRLPTDQVGQRTVSVTATDAAGNTVTTTVRYEVTGNNAGAQVDQLIAQVKGYKLPAARTTALVSQLQLAKLAIAANSRTVACVSLVAFELLVDTYAVLKYITATQRTQMKSASAAVRTTLAC